MIDTVGATLICMRVCVSVSPSVCVSVRLCVCQFLLCGSPHYVAAEEGRATPGHQVYDGGW